MDDTIAREDAFFESGGQTAPEVPQPEPAPEPVQAVENAPEAKPEEPKPEKSSVTHVPLATFLEQKALLKEQTRRLDKLQALIDGNNQPKQEPEPDPTQDPIKALQALNDWKKQQEQEKLAGAEIQSIATFGQQHAAVFAQEKPDFYDAFNHLRNARANQLMERVESADELNRALLHEEAQLIQLCKNWGVNPASFTYNLAISAGYAPKQAAPQVQEPTPKEKIEIAAQAQSRATAAVSKAPSGGNGKIDLKALIQMNGKDFDDATDGDGWRKLMGG